MESYDELDVLNVRELLKAQKNTLVDNVGGLRVTALFPSDPEPDLRSSNDKQHYGVSCGRIFDLINFDELDADKKIQSSHEVLLQESVATRENVLRLMVLVAKLSEKVDALPGQLRESEKIGQLKQGAPAMLRRYFDKLNDVDFPKKFVELWDAREELVLSEEFVEEILSANDLVPPTDPTQAWTDAFVVWEAALAEELPRKLRQIRKNELYQAIERKLHDLGNQNGVVLLRRIATTEGKVLSADYFREILDNDQRLENFVKTVFIELYKLKSISAAGRRFREKCPTVILTLTSQYLDYLRELLVSGMERCLAAHRDPDPEEELTDRRVDVITGDTLAER